MIDTYRGKWVEDKLALPYGSVLKTWDIVIIEGDEDEEGEALLIHTPPTSGVIRAYRLEDTVLADILLA